MAINFELNDSEDAGPPEDHNDDNNRSAGSSFTTSDDVHLRTQLTLAVLNNREFTDISVVENWVLELEDFIQSAGDGNIVFTPE